MNFTDIQLGTVTVTTEQNPQPTKEIEIEKDEGYVNIKAFKEMPATVEELEKMVDNLVAQQGCEDK